MKRLAFGAVARLLGGVAVALLAVPGTAPAASAVTFIAPPGARAYADHDTEGPVGYTEAPTAFRTSNVRPVIGIEADAGSQLVCHFDSVFDTQPCGAPEAGCGAVVCGSYQPSAPLTPDSSPLAAGHFLAVDVLDAGGNTVASMWLNLDVDTAPPVSRLDSANGILTVTDPLTPLRPSFSFEVSDSNDVGGDVDRVECSFAPVGGSPAWHPCGGSQSGPQTARPSRLPARHRLYLVQVRGTDDFERSTTSSAEYDPVPCAASIDAPGRLANLFSSGIGVRVRCDAIRHAAVAVYAFAENGRRATSPRGAVSDNPVLGELHLTGRRIAFTVNRRLRLFGPARQALGQVRSVGLVVAAGPPDKIEAGLADDSLSYHAFTVRR
jgi:hypothetical protein